MLERLLGLKGHLTLVSTRFSRFVAGFCFLKRVGFDGEGAGGEICLGLLL